MKRKDRILDMMKSIKQRRISKILLLPIMCIIIAFSMATPVMAQNSEHPAATEETDKNITVKKSASWSKDYDAQVKITVSGTDKFEAIGLPSDVVLVLDNSNSMYTPECYSKEHVIYLPYKGGKITDGVFAEKTKVMSFTDTDILSQETWDNTVIPGLYGKMEESLLWDIVADDAKSMTKKEAVDKYGPDLLGAGYKYTFADGSYIKMKAGAAASDKIGSNPINWTMYDSSNSLYTGGNIVNGVIYEIKEVTQPITENGIIDTDLWNNTILPQIKADFTPGMVIKLSDSKSLIYTESVNKADTSYAANSSNASNMMNWIIIDTGKAHTADFYSVPEIANDPLLLWDWANYALQYHFDISDGSIKRVGEVSNDGTFSRDVKKSDEDGCTVRATVLKNNIKALSSELLKSNSDNRISIVAFEDKVYESLDFTKDFADVDAFMDTMCSSPKTSAAYNTNYEAAWAETANKLDSAEKDSARFVIFITDGWPTAAGIGSSVHQDTNQNPAALKALVNGTGGIKDKYNAVVSTIGMGLDTANYDKYVSDLATNSSLEYHLAGDGTIVTSLKEAMEQTYKDIYLYAKNVCITDTIDYHFRLTDKAAFLKKYPQAKISYEIKDGKTYTKIFVSVGDVKASQSAAVSIPITLRAEYRDVEEKTYFPTNAGLVTEYLNPQTNKISAVRNDDPYLSLPIIEDADSSHKTQGGSEAKTGDESNMSLYVILMICAALGISVNVLRGNSRN